MLFHFLFILSLLKKESESVGLEDLDTLQFELETLLLKSVVSACKLMVKQGLQMWDNAAGATDGVCEVMREGGKVGETDCLLII